MEIKKVLKSAPTAKKIERLLEKVGLKMSDYYAFYGKDKINNGIKYSKDLKDRYTVFWLNYFMNHNPRFEKDKIKVIALDLDGTLTQHRQPIPKKNVFALKKLSEKYAFEFQAPSDLVLAEVEKRVEKLLSKQDLLEQIANADDSLVKAFQESFAYEYPYEQEKNKKSKYSVSELKHASMVEKYDRMEGEVEVPDFLQEEREPYIPTFAQKLLKVDESLLNAESDADNGLQKQSRQSETEVSIQQNSQNVTNKNVSKDGKQKENYVVDVHGNMVSRGALRGTAVHRVMECLDFKKILEVDTTNDHAIKSFLEIELARMLEKEQVTQEMIELVSMKKLIDFIKSSVTLRMARADENGDLFREKPFVMDHEGVLVQGIIDVFWLEEDKIVVLDYKTDKVQKAEELKTRYETQLHLYADALCRIFSTKERRIESAEKLIYSFCLDKVITIE